MLLGDLLSKLVSSTDVATEPTRNAVSTPEGLISTCNFDERGVNDQLTAGPISMGINVRNGRAGQDRASCAIYNIHGADLAKLAGAATDEKSEQTAKIKQKIAADMLHASQGISARLKSKYAGSEGGAVSCGALAWLEGNTAKIHSWSLGDSVAIAVVLGADGKLHSETWLNQKLHNRRLATRESILAMNGSYGDFSFESVGLTHTPIFDHNEIEVPSGGSLYIVIGSDGLVGEDYSSVSGIASEVARNFGKAPLQIAQQLTKSATSSMRRRHPSSCDDSTAVVMMLPCMSTSSSTATSSQVVAGHVVDGHSLIKNYGKCGIADEVNNRFLTDLAKGLVNAPKPEADLSEDKEIKSVDKEEEKEVVAEVDPRLAAIYTPIYLGLAREFNQPTLSKYSWSLRDSTVIVSERYEEDQEKKAQDTLKITRDYLIKFIAHHHGVTFTKSEIMTCLENRTLEDATNKTYFRVVLQLDDLVTKILEKKQALLKASADALTSKGGVAISRTASPTPMIVDGVTRPLVDITCKV